MNGKLPLISIVIPVFNEERYLGACLDSLSKLDYPDEKLEIVLVDNGSTDNTLEIASQYEIEVFLHPGVKVGAVRNYGVVKASGELIVFIDSDCVVETDWLQRGLTSMNEQYGAVGGLYLLREQPAWIERYWILQSARDFAYQTSFVGGCIFIRREVFEAVGGFNEVMSAGEDTDLTQRLREAGYRLKIDPQLSVVHLGYPNTIKSFVKRQMWHSENYYLNFPAVLGDKIFILTNVFLLGFILLLVSPWLGMPTFLVGGLLFGLAPLVLSMKRISRYKVTGMGFSGLLSVYLVDLLYLFGRGLGSLRSLRRAIIPDSERKYARR